MNVKISAVVCTYNRIPRLIECLNSLNHQTLPRSGYEVIVVDNSAAGTARATVADAQRVAGNLRYVHEPRPGLTEARNHGLRLAVGEYIAFIDDDAVADADWLEQAVKVHDAHHGTIGILGGQVRPMFEKARPRWLTDDLLPFLSMTNLGDAPADVTSAQGVVGANMIFGTRALRDVGGFSGDLGRKGAILLSNDELHVKFLLEQKGLKSVYHPQVGVSHHAASARLTKRWFRRRLYWQGRSDAIWWHNQNDASLSSRAAEAITAAILMAKHAAHWLRIARPKDCARSAFASECHLLSRVGYIVGLAKGNGARSLD